MDPDLVYYPYYSSSHPNLMLLPIACSLLPRALWGAINKKTSLQKEGFLE